MRPIASPVSISLCDEALSYAVKAHERLSEIYHWFTEGFDTADRTQAKLLLAALETDAFQQDRMPHSSLSTESVDSVGRPVINASNPT